MRPQVAAGIAWLDAHVPDWFNIVDVNQLDQSCDRKCVIGQLRFADEIPWDSQVSSYDEDLGFFLAENHDSCSRCQGWFDLTQEWIQAIEERRSLSTSA